MKNVVKFSEITMADIASVGGKNASLGEMIHHLTKAGVWVPGGFATTAEAYQLFLTHNNLNDYIYKTLRSLDITDVPSLKKVSQEIRESILQCSLSSNFIKDVKKAYQVLTKNKSLSVAVRSSATAEDLPQASFAGQQETFLNVHGIENVFLAIKNVYASLFTERAIAYRTHQKISHEKVSISAGIQQMVRSDKGASGVIFTLDTESGFDDVIFITAAYGLGEPIVQGHVNPDEFYVHKNSIKRGKAAILRRNLGTKINKMIHTENTSWGQSLKIIDVDECDRLRFSLEDNEIHQLAEQALLIEQHYKRPMDIEWAKDGVEGKLYIVQARPETVQSRLKTCCVERFRLCEKGRVKVKGRSIGQRIGQGIARVINNPKNMDAMKSGEILVADMTDPDWEPIMKRAAAIVTNRGGRTCHAAIIARELGIPAVVGCGNASTQIQSGEAVTVSCAEGETGHVYEGLVPYKIDQMMIDAMPPLPFKICMNLGNPEKAFMYRTIPNEGVGLARLEFMISNMIGIHPKALLSLSSLPSDIQLQIRKATQAYKDPVEYYIEKLREGIGTIAAAFYPKPVIVRFSDFKSNEYANLLGGQFFEPQEENPMLGYRGASRYLSDQFRDCFALECEAIKRVREDMQFVNTQVMIPFVRTVEEAKQVMDLLKQFGLERGKNKLSVFMMCEIPSNAILADAFLEYFDGFSIGSNDLTQLTLGLDRDSALVANLFDERDKSVKSLLHLAIQACKKAGKYVGICGQGPSDHPDFAKWLMDEGISSVSLSPDSVVETWLYLANRLNSASG